MIKVPHKILEVTCSTDCPRFRRGDCPYRYAEKSECPTVKAYLSVKSEEKTQVPHI